MRTFIKDLLSERNHASMLRVMSLISVLSAVTIGIVGVMKPEPDYSGLSLLVGTFLSAAFVGKVSQKAIEVKKQ